MAESGDSPPKNTRFQPGNKLGRKWKKGDPSPNPGGRPKGRAEVAAYIAEKLAEQETLDQLITALKLHAIKGSPTHMTEALNRVAGKVTDKGDLKVDVSALQSLTDEELVAQMTEALEEFKAGK